jgi:hypothetical protein
MTRRSSKQPRSWRQIAKASRNRTIHTQSHPLKAEVIPTPRSGEGSRAWYFALGRRSNPQIVGKHLNQAPPDCFAASSLSAISSSFVTLFQFLPVPEVFSFFSTVTHDSFERPMPSGK